MKAGECGEGCSRDMEVVTHGRQPASSWLIMSTTSTLPLTTETARPPECRKGTGVKGEKTASNSGTFQLWAGESWARAQLSFQDCSWEGQTGQTKTAEGLEEVRAS